MRSEENLVGRIALHHAGIKPGDGAAVALVDEAGGVAQQIMDVGRPVRRDPLAAFEHLHVGKGGDEVGDRLVEMQTALRREHQGDERHHRLRHRVDAKDRIRRHRRAGGAVAVAPHPPHHDLAAALDMQHGARHRAARDLDVEEIVDPRQARAGKAGDVRHLGVDAHGSCVLFTAGHDRAFRKPAKRISPSGHGPWPLSSLRWPEAPASTRLAPQCLASASLSS